MQMFNESSAPYILVLIVSLVGWALNMLADDFLKTPKLQYEKSFKKICKEEKENNICTTYQIKNLSNYIINDIQLRLERDISKKKYVWSGGASDPSRGGILKRGDQCGIFRYTGNYVGDAAPPICSMSPGPDHECTGAKVCDLPVAWTVEELYPGGSFEVEIMYEAKMTPPLIALKSAKLDDNLTSGGQVAFVSAWTPDAVIARNRTPILLILCGIGIVIIIILFRKKEDD